MYKITMIKIKKKKIFNHCKLTAEKYKNIMTEEGVIGSGKKK